MLSSFTRKEAVFMSLINNEMIINFSVHHLILGNSQKAYLLFKWKCQIAHSLPCFSFHHRENYTSSGLFSFPYFAWCGKKKKKKACQMQWMKTGIVELDGNICLLSSSHSVHAQPNLRAWQKILYYIVGYWSTLKARTYKKL